MKGKILIAEDTKSWQIFHTTLIQQLYGNTLDITIASSAFEALNIAKSNKISPFSFVITDLQMETNYLPLLAGEWLIKNIKMMKEYSNTNVVIVSSMYNINEIAKKYNVKYISKSMLVYNKLLMKYTLELYMPFLSQIE